MPPPYRSYRAAASGAAPRGRAKGRATDGAAVETIVAIAQPIRMRGSSVASRMSATTSARRRPRQ